VHAHEIAAIAGVLAAGFVCQLLAWRLRLPAILFLLLCGVAVGPVLGWLDTDALLGDLLIPAVSVAVAIILFEGSLTLKFSELGGHGGVVTRLVTIGVLITWVVSSLAAHYILGWDAELAALFGAIVTVSGPTVVMPLLRSVRPTPAVSQVLRWEAILIDPLGAVLALLTFNFIIASQTAEGIVSGLSTFVIITVTGTVLGAISGYAFGLALRRRWIPDFLREYAALATVLAIFAIAETVHSESGLLAVTVMGIWLANTESVDLDDVLSFKESVTLLLVAALFILLAARLDLEKFIALGTGAVVVVAFLQLIGGPLRAFASSIGSSLTFRERLFLGWVFPRGIVAAAISALFALRLEESGTVAADQLVPMVFAVIAGTVIVQSLTTRGIARLLGVAAPKPTGVLIVGANPLGSTYGTALEAADVKVLVADSHWISIRRARMAGLPTYHGNIVSSYAERNLDLEGLGLLLAVSRQPGLNELACVRMAQDFGRDAVFTVRSGIEEQHDKHKISGESSGRLLFAGERSIEELVGLIHDGWQSRKTKLSDEFGFEDYCAKHPQAVVMFAVNAKGRVSFPVGDEKFEPRPGWSITALAPPSDRSKPAGEDDPNREQDEKETSAG
jgi:NhaP-type Na+/H+ or K+/H+ antiporter